MKPVARRKPKAVRKALTFAERVGILAKKCGAVTTRKHGGVGGEETGRVQVVRYRAPEPGKCRWCEKPGKMEPCATRSGGKILYCTQRGCKRVTIFLPSVLGDR